MKVAIQNGSNSGAEGITHRHLPIPQLGTTVVCTFALFNMPLHVLDAEHGHEAIFLRASPSLSRLSRDISWGPCSIAVPSSSPLNGPADVWLRIPRYDEHSARRWCSRHNASFLAAWPSTSQHALTGFGFRVAGFSRYRYVESDDDPAEGEGEGEYADTELTASARRRARTHAAGRTPVRPAARRASPGRTPARKIVPASTSRARLTPSVALYDSDDDEEDENDDAVEETDGEGPESDGVDDSVAITDPFRPTAWGAGVDAPKLSKLRAALFDEPLAYGKMGLGENVYAGVGEPQREDEDVAMEDIPGEYDDPEDELYNMFDPSPRREGDQQGESDARPEAGDFVIDGEMRPRRPMADAFFPSTSLPFPTVEGSVSAGKEGITTDKGLMLGRSTRVSFSHSGLLVRPCYGVSEGDAFATPGFVTDVANLYVGSADVPRESLSKMLRVHCGAWFAAIAADDKEVEKGASVRTPTLKDSFVYPEVADATIEQFIEELKVCHEEGGDVNALHAQVALSMLLALYKKENDLAFGGGDTLLKRVALWAGGPAGTAFDEENNCRATGLRSALISLTLGNIEEAVATATRTGHLRLALVIARALESPKDDLRADAEAQLATYGLSLRREESGYTRQDEESNNWQWDDILDECPDDAAVSVDERMILLVLAGHVAPVARYMELSWYRLFIMEFFHGAGSSDLTQAERVSAAVEATSASEISTLAPHGCAQNLDVVYHLLRLYADPTASYSLTSGVYANGSFGSVYSPLDARFSWLTYQILTAVIHQASTTNAPQVLADEFSSQLRATGLHLWSYYVLCSGSARADVMKSALIRDWPNMESDFVEWIPAHGLESAKNAPTPGREDKIEGQKFEDVAGQLGAEQFLEEVLGVPREWIAEAKAVAAHVKGEHLEECKHWIATGTEDGASRAHKVLTTQVFPDMVSCRDSSRYGEVVEVLRHLEASKHVADWSISGGLILNYLEYVVGVPKVKRQPLVVYRGMVNLVRSWAARATTPEQHHTATVIADGIAAAERAQLFHAEAADRDIVLDQVVEDLERLPCSRGVKLRAAGEYKIEAQHGRAVALRFSAAYPPYARYMDQIEAADVQN